jgi:hypothetical protein
MHIVLKLLNRGTGIAIHIVSSIGRIVSALSLGQSHVSYLVQTIPCEVLKIYLTIQSLFHFSLGKF